MPDWLLTPSYNTRRGSGNTNPRARLNSADMNEVYTNVLAQVWPTFPVTPNYCEMFNGQTRFLRDHLRKKLLAAVSRPFLICQTVRNTTNSTTKSMLKNGRIGGVDIGLHVYNYTLHL